MAQRQVSGSEQRSQGLPSFPLCDQGPVLGTVRTPEMGQTRVWHESIFRMVEVEARTQGKHHAEIASMTQRIIRSYFSHLMRKVDLLEKTLMLGRIGGRRRRG